MRTFVNIWRVKSGNAAATPDLIITVAPSAEALYILMVALSVTIEKVIKIHTSRCREDKPVKVDYMSMDNVEVYTVYTDRE